MLRAICIVVMIIVSYASATTLNEIVFSCADKTCAIDLSFDQTKKNPRYLQKWKKSDNELHLYFEGVAFDQFDKSFKVLGSNWIKNVYIHKLIKKTKEYAVIKIRFYKKQEDKKVPISLKNGSTFVFSFKEKGRKPFKWTLKNKSVTKITQKSKASKTSQKKIAPIKKVNAVSPKEKPAQKRTELVDETLRTEAKVISAKKIRKSSQKSINTLQRMSYVKNRNLKRFYLSFLNPELESTIVLNGPIIQIEFEKLKYASKLREFSIPSNDMVRKISYKKLRGKRQIEIVLNRDSKMYRVFKFENKIIFQTANKSNSNRLTFWSSDVKVKEYVQDPIQAQETLDEFQKEVARNNGKAISTEQTFILGGGVKELISIGDRVSVRAKPSTQSRVLDYLGFGKRVKFIDVQGNWYKVTFNNMTGYVFKTLLSYEDKLTEEQGRRLIEHVNSSFAKLKQSVPAEAAMQLTVKELAIKEAKIPVVKPEIKPKRGLVNIKTSQPVEEKIQYSTFGRRDPFIPVTGPDDSGINIDGIKLVGIIWDKTSPIAILEDVRNTGISYTLQVGDKILNGKVERITSTEIVFVLSEFGVQRQYSMTLPEN